MVIAVIPFAVFMSIDVFDDVPASKCLGLLLFGAIMWALEVSKKSCRRREKKGVLIDFFGMW
jgi:hypothetical protein